MKRDPQSFGLVTDSPAQQNATPVSLLRKAELAYFIDRLDTADQTWLARQNFTANSSDVAWLSDGSVVCGWSGTNDLSSLGHLPLSLPAGIYQLTHAVSDLQLLGWALGSYQFTRYKPATREAAQLILPKDNDAASVVDQAAAMALGRDLINTPAQDMGPSNFTEVAKLVCARHEASLHCISGDALLAAGCGAIHAVGRAAADAPRLLDIHWGNPDHSKVTLVGKGVTFDSGGLNLKPGASMRLMKKDMGGAAVTLGLADLIMSQALPIRLRVLIPLAENAISGAAFRPGDILTTHKGLTVEIDNTDAEGRLLLCDALSIASEDQPELIVDFATLTGAARAAVGAEIAALFANEKSLADEIFNAGEEQDDPVWPMPLHKGYDYMIRGKVSDLVNSAPSLYAGAVTAGLFLQHFVTESPWVHFDLMAFNTRNRPGRPEGGEAMALRAVFHYLRERYGQS